MLPDLTTCLSEIWQVQQDFRLDPGERGLDPADCIAFALRKALSALAKKDRDAFLRWAERLKNGNLLLFHQALCDVLTEEAATYATWACHYLLEESNRFLVGIDGADTYFASRLVAAIFPHLTFGEKSRLERAIFSFYPPWTRNLAQGLQLGQQEKDERRYVLQRLHHRGSSQLALVEKVPDDALTPLGLRTKRELERRYPGYHPSERHIRVGMAEVKSPIPADRIASLTDDDLLVAMRHFDEHTKDGAHRTRRGEGGIEELVREVATAAAANPMRFRRLVTRLDDSVATAYVGAVLDGLVKSDLDSPSVFQACREAIARHAEARDVKEALCEAAEKRLKDGVPEDIREHVRRVAVSTDPADGHKAETLIDHDGRMWSLTLRARALRVWALCYLDRADTNPNDALPTLETLTRDPDVSVRQSLIELLPYFLHLDRDRVSAMFERTVEDRPDLVETYFAARFVQYNLHRNGPSMLRHVEQMAGSQLKEARKSAGNLATLAFFDWPQARDHYRRCARGDAALRLGVVEVFACNVDKAEVQQRCLNGMEQFMDDDDDEVRLELATAFNNLPPPTPEIEKFIAALIKSRALSDVAWRMMEYLQQHYLSIPKLTLDAAEEVHARLGRAIVDISSKHALVDDDLVNAIVALYNHCPKMRERAMSIFERLMLLGSRHAGKALEVAGR